ncbi:MAG: acyl-CoA dehydrogenase C-terminal domain-containing protein [Deltaproteobacteria bacterium]|nr:acyl-CoA dehydrogenase C-terminal domain-containing protein [Deltaproteobacteria bacterium]
MKKGSYFMILLAEMNATIARYADNPNLMDMAQKTQAAVNDLVEAGMYFAGCGKEGKFLVPVSQAYPFLMMMGKVVSAWLLLWQAGVADEKTDALCENAGVDRRDPRSWSQFLKENKDAAFYAGKTASLKFFVNHILPEVNATLRSIKSDDISMLEIAEESFAW